MRMAEVEIIKASQIKREIAQNSHKLLKVAAYCRVSTDDDEQLRRQQPHHPTQREQRHCHPRSA